MSKSRSRKNQRHVEREQLSERASEAASQANFSDEIPEDADDGEDKFERMQSISVAKNDALKNTQQRQSSDARDRNEAVRSKARKSKRDER